MEMAILCKPPTSQKMCLLKSEMRLASSLPTVCSGGSPVLPAGCHSSVTLRKRMLGMSSGDRTPDMCMFCQNSLAPGKNMTGLVCSWYIEFLTIHSMCQSCLWTSLNTKGETQVAFLQRANSSLQLSRTLESGSVSAQFSLPHSSVVPCDAQVSACRPETEGRQDLCTFYCGPLNPWH